jgi:hypothetical protein
MAVSTGRRTRVPRSRVEFSRLGDEIAADICDLAQLVDGVGKVRRSVA